MRRRAEASGAGGSRPPPQRGESRWRRQAAAPRPLGRHQRPAGGGKHTNPPPPGHRRLPLLGRPGPAPFGQSHEERGGRRERALPEGLG